MLRPPRGLVRSAVVLLAGCAGPRESRDAAVDSPRVVVTPPAAAPGDTACRLSGLWARCSVEDRMLHAGLVATRRPEAVTLDLFSVPGIGYDVGVPGDEVQVFLYGTAEARRADTDRLDSLSVSLRGQRRSYPVLPLLVTSNNLAALVFTRNERSQERIANALSAGLPQPRP